jgi:hypothetical protein
MTHLIELWTHFMACCLLAVAAVDHNLVPHVLEAIAYAATAIVLAAQIIKVMRARKTQSEPEPVIAPASEEEQN